LKLEGARIVADDAIRASDKVKQIAQTLDRALEKCGAVEGAGMLWLDRIQMEKGRSNGEDGMAVVLFRMVKAGASEDDVLTAVKRIADLAEQGDKGACVMALKRPLPSKIRGALLQEIIHAALDAGSHEQAAAAFERWAGEDCARHDHSGWLEWEEALRAKGTHKEANAALWRARRVLADPAGFDEALALRDAPSAAAEEDEEEEEGEEDA